MPTNSLESDNMHILFLIYILTLSLDIFSNYFIDDIHTTFNFQLLNKFKVDLSAT